MGTHRQDPVITNLQLTNAGDYNYKVTLWVIPFSTKNDQCTESDLIEHDLGTLTPYNGTVTIDVTDWSEWLSAKQDACYIEVEKSAEPLSVYISGPYEISRGDNPVWTANPSGGEPGYEYNWQYRLYNENDGWTNWLNRGGDQEVTISYPNHIYDRLEWRITVTDADSNTAQSLFTVTPE